MQRVWGTVVGRKADALDKSLMARLVDDGRLALAELAQRAGVSRPTAASRIRCLTNEGIMRVAAVVDVFRLHSLTLAFVGLAVDKHRLDEKVEQIAALPEVTWAAVVTGRYDIMAEVVTEGGMEGLYDFLNVSLREVGGISASEMFVVMKARNHWMLLPEGLRRAWTAAGS